MQADQMYVTVSCFYRIMAHSYTVRRRTLTHSCASTYVRRHPFIVRHCTCKLYASRPTRRL